MLAAVSSPSTAARARTGRPALLERALRLSWISIGFGLVAGSVSVGSGIADHSLGVLAAGPVGAGRRDRLGRAGLALPHRALEPRIAPEHVEDLAALRRRRRAGDHRGGAAFESIHALIAGSHPGSSALTVATSAVSIVVLMPLAYLKRETAARLGSHALKGDSTLSAIGASTALLALIGLVLYHAFGWWWADRVVALVIAGGGGARGVHAAHGRACGRLKFATL